MNVIRKTTTLPDGREISIETVKDLEKNLVTITVSNDGPPIPQYIVDKGLFKKKLKTIAEGRARLGLPLCREMVKYHGDQCEIWLERNNLAGVAFSFTFPLSSKLEKSDWD